MTALRNYVWKFNYLSSRHTNVCQLLLALTISCSLFRQIKVCSVMLAQGEDQCAPFQLTFPVPKSSWAHLSSDENSFVPVHIVVIINPSLFFVKLSEFHHNLVHLEEEMNAMLSVEKEPLRNISSGKYCAVKSCDDDNWNRALIKNVEEDVVTLFLVDYGIECSLPKNEIFKLPSKFISKLPFQAIECGLVGISPANCDEWLDQSCEAFAIMSTAGEYWNQVFVQVCESKLKAKETGGRRYEVIFVDTSGPRTVIVNEEMVNRGYAVWKPHTRISLMKKIKAMKVKFEEPNPDQKIIEVPKELIEEKFLEEEKILKEEIINNPKDIVPNFEEIEVEGEVSEYLPPSLKQLLFSKGEHPKKLAIGEQKITEESSSEEEYEDDYPSNDESDRPPPLVNVGTLFPGIIWRQNNTHVWVRICLTDVRIYTMTWSSSFFTFSTRLDDKHYFAKVILFGPILKQSLEHQAYGQYSEIKFEKVLKGHMWPRLTFSKRKNKNIKLDLTQVDTIDPVQSSSIVEQMYRAGVALWDEKKRLLRDKLKTKKTRDIEKEDELHVQSDLESESDGDSYNSDPEDHINPLF